MQQFTRRPQNQRGYFVSPSYPVHTYVPPQGSSSSTHASSSTHNDASGSGATKAEKQVGANFLPSIVNEAYHNVLEQVVTAICYKYGFDDIEEGALETLMLLFHTYLKRIGEQARLGCEVAGRTIVTPGDVWFGLINMGIKVHQLPQFLVEHANLGLTVHPPEITKLEQKPQPLRVGTARPHPNYVFEWLPPLPDPHTYIKTKIQEDPEFTYEKVREAMAQKKRNGVTSLVNYMVRNYPSHCLFPNFERTIHEQVKETFAKESETKRMQEAFVAWRDLVSNNRIDEVKNVGKMLFDKGLISQHDLDSGTEVVCMTSDGTLIDQNGERVKLTENAIVDLEEQDQISTTSTRITECGGGAESLRYHWNMDKMLDEIIELDSCTMDFSSENAENGVEKSHDELKYMQERTTFEYIPEWCHILKPSFEHRAYLSLVPPDLKVDDEQKKEKEKEKEKENVGDTETPTKGGKEEDVVHENLYLQPIDYDDDGDNLEKITEKDEEDNEELELTTVPLATSSEETIEELMEI